ncbi:MAG: hypothetical protein ABFS38_13305 [Bacteroidota bacterium]
MNPAIEIFADEQHVCGESPLMGGAVYRQLNKYSLMDEQHT